MHLLIKKDYEGLSSWAADYIIKRINKFSPTEEKPFVLGLPTGSSPLGVYKNLISACKEGKVSFKNVITFNMDEYVGLTADHPQSYIYFMKENFFNHIDILPENTHILNGMAKNVEAECLAYEKAIKAAGGVELFLGGTGGNGHIAFNEPGSPIDSRTRVVNLTDETRIANARFFDENMEKVPTKALTIGIATIMNAKEVIILASGRQKAHAVKAAIKGPACQECPLSYLQKHPNAILAYDEEAAEDSN